MKKTPFIIIITLLTIGCNLEVKDSKSKIEIEKGTEVVEQKTPLLNEEFPQADTLESEEETTSVMGSWVGYFREDVEDNYNEKGVYVDEGFYWTRENKINISIDKIKDSLVIGHSVVAGNDRPFKGFVTNGVFIVKEPGDDKYDGEFKFKISEGKLIGKWSAYKDIDIKHRKYELEKRQFSYNPDIMLERAKEYVNWNSYNEEKTKVEYDEGQFEEWLSTEFATATQLIYEINASNTLLKKEDVENLKKGDISIIRNTIYARHGYSFKNRPLRVFFDAQSWYIPIHTDIKSEFTELEKKNIQLLLRYEKNALEYYDYFGRG